MNWIKTQWNRLRQVKKYNLLQLVGAACAVVGFFIIAVWLGFILTGLALTAYGVLLERDTLRRGDS